MLNTATILTWVSALLLGFAGVSWIAFYQSPVLKPILGAGKRKAALAELACGLMVFAILAGAIAAVSAIVG